MRCARAIRRWRNISSSSRRISRCLSGLKTDFKPAEGGKDIFDKDPLIPVAWHGDWNLSVVLQDEASGAATGGTLYLTNIHRLYDMSERRKKEAETYDFIGPKCFASESARYRRGVAEANHRT